jgi:hypothetical protein
MKTVAPSWVFFLVTGVFISLIVPLGEGFDEPYHFSYVRVRGADRQNCLPVRQCAFPAKSNPLCCCIRQAGASRISSANLQSQEDYWHNPDRSAADATLRSMRFSGEYREGRRDFAKQYESHQAPLYYLLTAPLFYAGSRLLSFSDTFLLIRLWSVLLASAVVPLSYLLAARLSASERTAALVPVLVALFPGIYPDIVRVSNDALAVPIAAMIFTALARYVDLKAPRDGMLLSIALTAGLLTKAFFIPVFVVIVFVMLWMRPLPHGSYHGGAKLHRMAVVRP